MSDVSSPPLSYAEFGTWYDRYRATVLEPALDSATAALDGELLDVLSDRDLARLRNAAGRVKSKRRTWRKIRHPRYVGRIASMDDIPTVIDDLVGLRITCTNLRDIEMVQAALETLPRSPETGSLWLDPETERDYVVEPKESGYRGWHVNLGIAINVDGTAIQVPCELQVRTLLQDSWGELTHEDTYSKDGALPPLVEVLSKRMADLFATLDDIAEDLRTELDRIDEAVIGQAAATPSAAQPLEPGVPSEQSADATTFLAEQWSAIDRPTDLAVLAWTMQREFGAEISDDWFGHGTFKRFLTDALPDAEISTGRHAFLLPVGSVADDIVNEPDEAPTAGSVAVDDAMPETVIALRRVDRAFPLLERGEWSQLFETLADSWKRKGALSTDTSDVSRLARSARDRADARGAPVSRRHLSYVIRAVATIDEIAGPLSAEEIAESFTISTLQRMVDLRILGARNRKGRAAVRAWLNG